jgi:hypothetical protein
MTARAGRATMVVTASLIASAGRNLVGRPSLRLLTGQRPGARRTVGTDAQAT